MSDDNEVTPVNGIQLLVSEVRELKAQCQRIADQGLQQNEEIPKLRREMRRLTLFQAWFPTAAITVAIIVRLIWLR